MEPPLAAVYDLMLEFQRAVRLDDVYRVLLSRCARFGVTSVLAGVIPQRIVHPSEQPGYVILGHWPQEWAQRYFHRQYVRRDPTIRHCALKEAPLIWSTMEYGFQEVLAKRIMDEARDFNLLDGLTIPHLTLNGTRIGISFSGDRISKDQRSVTELTVLGTYAVARALEIRAAVNADPVHLTSRERECLTWAGAGKTNADVATILGISDSAVEKYLSAARQKLTSLTTTQAVCAALRLGLI